MIYHSIKITHLPHFLGLLREEEESDACEGKILSKLPTSPGPAGYMWKSSSNQILMRPMYDTHMDIS